MKNYYSILEIERTAGEPDIKRAYRTLAMRYHPDRNPGNPVAGEKFREITEAYGVLMDPDKRREYDQCLRYIPSDPGSERPGFSHTQEDIFRDLFNNPALYHFFNELARDFGKSGVRFDPSFFKSIFFRQGGIFFVGAIFSAFSPFKKASRVYNFFKMAQTAHHTYRRYKGVRGRPQGEIKSERPPVKDFLSRGIQGLFRKKENSPSSPGDLSFMLRISSKEATAGAKKPMIIPVNGQEERITVKIPPDTQPGARLRIRGKGAKKEGKAGRGDLYLIIDVQ